MQYIIASHGRLAEGYSDTIKLVTQAEGLHAVCAYTEGIRFPENMGKLLDSFGSDETVVVFTDLLGGSVTQKIMELWGKRENFHVFAGINLPFVLEMILFGSVPSKEYTQTILTQSREQMIYVNDLIGEYGK